VKSTNYSPDIFCHLVSNILLSSVFSKSPHWYCISLLVSILLTPFFTKVFNTNHLLI